VNHQQFALLVSLTKRDIDKRYKHSIVGALWGLLVPLVMLAIYTAIFSTIFGAKWGGVQVRNHSDYAVLLFVGLIVFTMFAEAIARAPTAILANPNLVKKVVFPLEVLPIVVVLSCAYSALIACIPLLLFIAFSSFGLHWQILGFPLLLVPFAALTLGVVYIFSSLGVFFRDVDQAAALLARILQYLTPVLYPSSIFPDAIGSWMRLSPLAIYVEQIRALVVFGQWPDWGRFAWATTFSMATLWFGWWWFRRTKGAFADVV
jgi:lipopolysaccharide transport system permease protein